MSAIKYSAFDWGGRIIKCLILNDEWLMSQDI
jgi:hypothetical protein